MDMERPALTQQARVSPRTTETTVIFVGHARLPASFAPGPSPVVSVELEVDMAREAIVGTSVKGVLPLGARLLDDVLTGRNMGDGPQQVVEQIAQRYASPSHKAVCAAVANAYEAYYRYREQAPPSS